MTRSPHRPNPIGVHKVMVTKIIDERTFTVSPLEVIEGTPIVDIKVYVDEHTVIKDLFN